LGFDVIPEFRKRGEFFCCSHLDYEAGVYVSFRQAPRSEGMGD
jgi:hypothetical protein